MTAGYSESYLNRYVRFPHLPHMHILLKLERPINYSRKIMRMIFPVKKESNPGKHPEINMSAIESVSNHFDKHKWCYVEDILNNEFYLELLRQWPKRRYLSAPKKITKCYDVGFNWVRGNKDDPDHIDSFPPIKALLNYMRTDEVGKIMTKFAGSRKELSCYSFIVSASYPGSLVAPHMDGVVNQKDINNFMNCVFFINGTGGENSGGLSIIEDMCFDNVIFEPKKLKNTSLIYDSIAPFYHGFKPIKFPKFRWAILVQFCNSDFGKK